MSRTPDITWAAVSDASPRPDRRADVIEPPL
jgi:hypothetical protein